MGIYCEINIHKPENGAFVGTAGTIVSGLIKYGVDEETVFNKITVSLKGIGALHVEKKTHNNEKRKYYKRETYIDIDDVISENKDVTVSIGTYEVPFKFEITQNVPPTLAYRNRTGIGRKCYVRCNVTYYVRIKFNRPGFTAFTKRFKKEITIISGIVPRLSTTPIIYGGQKKMSQLFTRKQRIINIKANILNSVLKNGDKIVFSYEVTNDTDIVISAVETKLVEIYKFYVNEREITRQSSDIPETDSKTGTIQKGQTQEMLMEINIPSDRESADFSKLFSRDYFIFITVRLPIPHINHTLEIPVQIGNSIVENVSGATHSGFEDNPPSYWEAMNEYCDEIIDLNSKS